MADKISIGFQVYLGPSWMAGQTTVASILQAVRALGPEAAELSLVQWAGSGSRVPEAMLPWVDRTVNVPYRPAKSTANGRSLRRRLAHLLGQAPAPAGAARAKSEVVRQHGIDCVFTTPMLNRPEYGVPTLLWLPDLQHVALPEMMEKKDRAERDQLYRREVAEAARILVTAETVRDDLKQFSPPDAPKARVVPFVIPIPAGLYEQDPAALAASYHLPERYFWLPNQFWKHKNHQVVLEALHRLQARAVYPHVVCAGAVHDHRNPQHLSDLLHLASKWNLREQFILLGLVPHHEVLLLLRQAVCLLNPSLFEGFGFSVAESKFVGKRALLSDLPAHREQDPPQAVYFDPHDAADLADKMEAIWRTAAPGPDQAMEAAARAAFPEQQRAFGRQFLELAHETARQPGAVPALS